MDISPGWQPDPEREGQDRYWDGSVWTDQVRPSGSAAASHLPEHVPELQRALAAATADIDAVEERLSTLFDRAVGGRSGLGADRRSPIPRIRALQDEAESAELPELIQLEDDDEDIGSDEDDEIAWDEADEPDEADDDELEAVEKAEEDNDLDEDDEIIDLSDEEAADDEEDDEIIDLSDDEADEEDDEADAIIDRSDDDPEDEDEEEELVGPIDPADGQSEDEADEEDELEAAADDSLKPVAHHPYDPDDSIAELDEALAAETAERTPRRGLFRRRRSSPQRT
jgi:hypothetical protein